MNLSATIDTIDCIISRSIDFVHQHDQLDQTVVLSTEEVDQLLTIDHDQVELKTSDNDHQPLTSSTDPSSSVTEDCLRSRLVDHH